MCASFGPFSNSQRSQSSICTPHQWHCARPGGGAVEGLCPANAFDLGPRGGQLEGGRVVPEEGQPILFREVLEGPGDVLPGEDDPEEDQVHEVPFRGT